MVRVAMMDKIKGFCCLMILFTFQLSPDKLRQFTELEGCGAISHVRLTIYPHARGVSRLRCWGVPAPVSEYSKLLLYKLDWRFNQLGILRFSDRECRPGCLDARGRAFQVTLTKVVLPVRNGIFTSLCKKKPGKGNWNWLVHRSKFLPREPFWFFFFFLQKNELMIQVLFQFFVIFKAWTNGVPVVQN